MVCIVGAFCPVTACNNFDDLATAVLSAGNFPDIFLHLDAGAPGVIRAGAINSLTVFIFVSAVSPYTTGRPAVKTTVRQCRQKKNRPCWRVVGRS